MSRLNTLALAAVAAVGLALPQERPADDVPQKAATQFPWVTPGSVGSKSPNAQLYCNKWGWNIPNEIGRALSDATVCATNNAVVSTHNSGAGGRVAWSDVRVYGTPETTSTPVKVKWAFWARSVSDWTMRNVTVDTITGEHAWYLGDAYNLLLERVEVEDVWGQGLQTVYVHPGSKRWNDGHESRHYGNPSAWWREFQARRWDWQTVRDSTFTQVAIPPLSERGSFVLSFFEMEYPIQANPVRVEGSYFRTRYEWTDANGVLRDCAGAIMVHGRLRAEIVGNRIDWGRGDRDLMQLWGITDHEQGTADITIRNNWVTGTKPIDIRVWDPGTSIDIGRNRGNVEVIVSSNPPYVWESNGWDESLVLYRGPISKAYTLN